MKTVKDVLNLIEKGVPPRLALDECGYGEVSDDTMKKLNKHADLVRSKIIQGLFASANSPRESAQSRAKALQQWEKMVKEDSRNQTVTIIIEGEKSE